MSACAHYWVHTGNNIVYDSDYENRCPSPILPGEKPQISTGINQPGDPVVALPPNPVPGSGPNINALNYEKSTKYCSTLTGNTPHGPPNCSYSADQFCPGGLVHWDLNLPCEGQAQEDQLLHHSTGGELR